MMNFVVSEISSLKSNMLSSSHAGVTPLSGAECPTVNSKGGGGESGAVSHDASPITLSAPEAPDK